MHQCTYTSLVDRTEQLHFQFSLSCIGEGNGNPLQNSCLEDPHGQKSLAGYSPWGCEETRLSGFTFSFYIFFNLREKLGIWETQVRSLGWEDLEKRTATNSSILAWRIPWIIQSMGLQRVGHRLSDFHRKGGPAAMQEFKEAKWKIQLCSLERQLRSRGRPDALALHLPQPMRFVLSLLTLQHSKASVTCT